MLEIVILNLHRIPSGSKIKPVEYESLKLLLSLSRHKH